MARKEKTEGTKVKDAVVESGSVGETTADDALDPISVAEAVLDLCDLAIRNVTVDQRGRTSLAAKDEAVLRAIVNSLEGHRHAHAAVTVGSKVQRLTPDMQSLGWIRHQFDDLCRYAAEQPPTPERDQKLAEHLSRACGFPVRFKIRPEHVEQAVEEVRQASLDNRARQGNDEDLAGIPSDWLRTAKSSDDRFSAVSASGKLLEAVIRISGETSARAQIPRPLDASFSGSSTAEYSQRVLTQIKAATARLVKPSARLTFLMTVLGAPLNEAPWLAYQLSLLLEGRSLVQAFDPGPDDYKPKEPTVPVPFRLYDEATKQQIVESARKRFLVAGLSETDATEDAAYQALHPFTPEPTPWAGTEVGEPDGDRSAAKNPWTKDEKRVGAPASKVPGKEPPAVALSDGWFDDK
jgi:hypothetical protein